MNADDSGWLDLLEMLTLDVLGALVVEYAANCAENAALFFCDLHHVA